LWLGAEVRCDGGAQVVAREGLILCQHREAGPCQANNAQHIVEGSVSLQLRQVFMGVAEGSNGALFHVRVDVRPCTEEFNFSELELHGGDCGGAQGNIIGIHLAGVWGLGPLWHKAHLVPGKPLNEGLNH
jgi:hypothetical protein